MKSEILAIGVNYWNLYHNYEKYLLSPLKPRFLALNEQYLPNISDPVYSVHQSFMWFLRLNRRKSTFYPVTAPKDSKCWPIVTSSIQELAASNCDVTMTDCSRVVSMDAFLTQWCWGQAFFRFFLAATKQLYEWYFLSVCPSVRLSHLFDYVPIIVSSWNFQELSHWTRVRSMQKVKVRGQRSRSQRSRPKFSFPDCNSSLNSHMMIKLYI